MKSNLVLRRRVPSELSPLDQAIVFVSTGFGPGWAPFAPATVASAVMAAALFLAAGRLTFARLLAIAVVTTVVGIALGRAAERVQAGKDPKWFVLDEYAGMAIVFLLNPISWAACIAGFVLFRAFDVMKLWPADRCESLQGGWGIMLDDLFAGLYAGIALMVLRAILALVHPA